METIKQTAPALFLTDYASYNEGIQFKHGHWVDLTQFNDADEFSEYVTNHFEKVGIHDPEPMFTDFEGFPKHLYSESYSQTDLENLFFFLALDEHDQAKFAYCLDQGYKPAAAQNEYEDIVLYEYNSEKDIWYLFEQYYPDSVKAEETCPFLEINYDAFKDSFSEFEYEGQTYLVSE